MQAKSEELGRHAALGAQSSVAQRDAAEGGKVFEGIQPVLRDVDGGSPPCCLPSCSPYRLVSA
jgi:hypothetical protein